MELTDIVFAIDSILVAVAMSNNLWLIIAGIGIKMVLEYLHATDYVDFKIPRWFSLGLIVEIFAAAFIYARKEEWVDAVDSLTEKAEAILDAQPETIKNRTN